MASNAALQAVDNNQVVQAPDYGVTAGFQSERGFALLQRMAKMFCYSSLVPPQFQGENNFANCVIALNMAQRMGADPMMVMQNLYIVYGNPAWSAKFMIACFNRSGRYAPIKYKETGKKGTDSEGIIAYSKDLVTGEELQGSEVTIGIAKAEGWYDKNGSKWKSMPQQMLRYRAASWFIRSTAPEISMGFLTVDEAEEIEPRNITPDVRQEVQQEIAAQANSEDFEPEPTEPTQAAPALPPKEEPAPMPEAVQEANVAATQPVEKAEVKQQPPAAAKNQIEMEF